MRISDWIRRVRFRSAYGIGAAALFGVVAPNSGNQSILVKYGTEEQKQKWLMPLIDGEVDSGFSMTEPANAGSDPRSLTTRAVLDGDHWVINGHKWLTSNGIDRSEGHTSEPQSRMP